MLVEVVGWILGGLLVIGAAAVFVGRFMKVGRGPSCYFDCLGHRPDSLECTRRDGGS